MSEHERVRRFIQKQLEKRQAIALELIDQPVPTYEKYRELVGRAAELQESIELARKIFGGVEE